MWQVSSVIVLTMIIVGCTAGAGRSVSTATPQAAARSVQRQSSDMLIQQLKDQSPNVRRQAAYELGKIKDARAVDPLIAALKDEDSRVRAQAAWALGGIKDARAVDPLIAALKDKDTKVRAQAASALGGIKDARAVDPLIAALKDKDTKVRAQAAEALGWIKDTRAVDPGPRRITEEASSEQSTLFTGRKNVANEWETCIQAMKDTSSQDPVLRFTFAGPTKGTLYIDGEQVLLFEGVECIRGTNWCIYTNMYKGDLKSGKHRVKIEVEEPSILTNLYGYDGVRLCLFGE